MQIKNLRVRLYRSWRINDKRVYRFRDMALLRRHSCSLHSSVVIPVVF